MRVAPDPLRVAAARDIIMRAARTGVDHQTLWTWMQAEGVRVPEVLDGFRAAGVALRDAGEFAAYRRNGRLFCRLYGIADAPQRDPGRPVVLVGPWATRSPRPKADPPPRRRARAVQLNLFDHKSFPGDKLSRRKHLRGTP